MSKIKSFFRKTKQAIKSFFSDNKKRTYFIIGSCFAFSVILTVSITTICAINYPDYIYIEDEEDLEKIRNNLSGDFIFTKQNINITNDWVPIGTKETPFTGTILGNDCTISFSKKDFSFVSNEGQDYFGFIGYNEGTIKGLKLYLHEMNLTSNNDETIFGCVSAFNKGSISTCTVVQASGKINIDAKNDLIVGGVCGIGSHNFVKLNCAARFALDSDTKVVASGIVGFVDNDADMWESRTTSQITISNSLESITGGLIGSTSAESKFSITNSSSRMTYSNESNSAGINGGVVGISNSGKSKIKNVYSNCNITNYIDVKSSNFIGEGDFEVLNCISNPNFINDLNTTDFGSYTYRHLDNVSFENCYYTKTYNNSFDYYGEYSSLDKLSLEKMKWDNKIWRKNSDGGFELI